MECFDEEWDVLDTWCSQEFDRKRWFYLIPFDIVC